MKENTLDQGRPDFPKRAIVTAGMPYGNKELHYGHIGGVFIHADVYARFLRDRLGRENVLFVSGTDCYGSAIEQSFNQQKDQENGQPDIIRFVEYNHKKQKEVLDRYEIIPDLFGTSALGEPGRIHAQVSEEIFEKLYESGALKLTNTLQFYDSKYNTFLNGRQVHGRCPINGCKSEIAYADECALGHQYMETELLQPVSTLSGEKPELREVRNWYFDLESYRTFLEKRQEELRQKENCRGNYLYLTDEFYREPMLYIKRDYLDDIRTLRKETPEFRLIDEDKKPSVTLVFSCLADREAACDILNRHDIRFRKSKTLVPLRISGNVDWGIPVPEKEGVKGLTFWVWPESLWAPISFTRTILKQRGYDDDSWEDWWMSEDAEVYQFIGEDNVYFYGIAEMALFKAISQTQEKAMHLPVIVPNHHVLYRDSKVSSSGKVKPPTAGQLLERYTPEQLRMHFLSMKLDDRSVNFQPMAFSEEEYSVKADTTLKEGNLLTNVFNRLVRSAFYSMQKHFDGKLPVGKVSGEVIRECNEIIINYEKKMYRFAFHEVIDMLDIFVRNCNKDWVRISKEAGEDKEMWKQLIIDAFHQIRVLTTLFHPIAPSGCEKVREYMNVTEELWSWEHIFEDIYCFIKKPDTHVMKFLEPRNDFFSMQNLYK